ncbi:MAG: hypothetical protein KatS3mg110_3236 [Pirellulaceae bacterium]|nr:MAG: hypothetical protein KatS3mg110_3236 [Pirellulaceae bacterium]
MCQRRWVFPPAGGHECAPDARNYPPGPKPTATKQHLPTVGEKSNACTALALPDCQPGAVWDDDICLPWYVELMARVIEAGHAWSIPAEAWRDRTYLEHARTAGFFHGARGSNARSPDFYR